MKGQAAHIPMNFFMNISTGRTLENNTKGTTPDKKQHIWTIVLCVVMVVSTLILLTLCADEGIDYDEAYSFQSARDYTQAQIVQKMIDDYDTDVPLYYNALRVWILLFGGIGHRFFAARIFSVTGAVASMLLGLTAIRRLWGNRTALFFMIATALAPAMLHVSVNIRMYSWTNFLVTASAVLAFCIVQQPEKKWRWILLGVLAAVALFSHYFTAFAYAAIYLYLLVALFIHARKELWKVFVSGGLPVAALLGWMVVSGFFHFVKTDSTEVTMKKITVKGLLYYLFQTDMRFCLTIGVTLVLVAFVGGALFLKNKERRSEKGFALMCVAGIFVIYMTALVLSSFASHFFIPRHIMHATGMMWLGIAIVLPRINWQVYLSGLAVLTSVCYANYLEEYESAYRDTPYLEDTKVFIETQMEPGDVVIYSSPEMYGRLYLCYMPEQEFMWLPKLEDADIQALAGKRVWYFSTNWKEYFTDDQVEKFGISAQNVGHYGFQIMDNCTDFDLLRLEIKGQE